MGRVILERESELAELGLAAREALAGSGSIVLIEGEAGIGKSSLVDAIRSVLPAEGRLLLGWCDDLVTPRVLGPLRDLRDQVGPELVAALDAGDRGRVGEALRGELDWPGHSTVLVVEDVHWADEATLDVLRFLVRRVELLPAVVVLTHRDEIAADHPLRSLLGLASRVPRTRRLQLQRLTLDAVRRLGSDTALDPEQIYDLTAGNPFLVTEVLVSRDIGRVPPSIAEAVGARLSALDGVARDAVERLSVIPSTVERWLVDAVVSGGLVSLGPAEERGVLHVSPSRVGFRHELTRRAVADSLSAVRRVACNEAVLSALLAHRGSRGVDLSRIVHHAAEVGDEAAIVEFGPLAQQEAVAAGSHREAVAHGRLVLAHRSAFVPAVRVEILERHAIECYAAGRHDESLGAQREAVALRRELGDQRALGLSLRWLSRIAWWAGDRDLAEASGDEAVAVLSGAGDDHALAWAWSNRSQLLALAGRSLEAIEAGERAIAMARSLTDPGLLSHALNNTGFAAWHLGRPEGRSQVEEALRVALDAGETEHACRAYVNLSWDLMHDLRYDEAAELQEAGMVLAEESEFVSFLRYLQVGRAMNYLARGAWDDAFESAAWGLDDTPMTRCPALTVTGRLRARQGVAGADRMLVEAVELGRYLREAQRIGPAGSALLEAAWLSGSASDLAEAAHRVLPWFDEVFRYGAPGVVAELSFWLRVAGQEVPLPEVEHPYADLAAGRWHAAASRWERAGCPYERALALSYSSSADDLMMALSIVDSLGALPLGRIVRDRLRDLGVSRIPRGPAPSTRENPAGLTDRQVEVLRLLADGLTNAEIAARLVLSVRTVDTHVAAILAKLDAPTRRDAARRAADLGLNG